MTRLHLPDHHREFDRRWYLLLVCAALLSVVMLVMLPRPNPVLAKAAPPAGGIAGLAEATRLAAPAPPSFESRVVDISELDSWRNEAVLGDTWAGVQLVAALLTQYERSHESDDLLEAVLWMERGWSFGEYQNSGMATRVFERHCDHKVLRWHWICDRGE